MSDETRIRRLPERAVDDRDTIYSILDQGLVCHAAYINEGRPVVIPLLYARDGDRVLLHGSNSMGLARAVRHSSPLSVAVTIIDGLVVARSAFNSSANYRSVVIHGQGRILTGEDKRAALDLIVEKLIPGRLADVRPSTEAEVAQTAVIAIDLDRVSAKSRHGGPVDDDADLSAGVWAGVVPLSLVSADPVPAEDLAPGIEIPDYLRTRKR